MPPKSNHSQYNLYKKPCKDGTSVWYARYWDPSQMRYKVTRSTEVVAEGKRERKAEADECAREMLLEIELGLFIADKTFKEVPFLGSIK